MNPQPPQTPRNSAFYYFDNLTLEEIRTNIANAQRFIYYESTPRESEFLKMSPIPTRGWARLESYITEPRNRAKEANLAGILAVILSMFATVLLLGFTGLKPETPWIFLTLAAGIYMLVFWRNFKIPDQRYDKHAWLDFDQRVYRSVKQFHGEHEPAEMESITFDDLFLFLAGTTVEPHGDTQWTIEISSWTKQTKHHTEKKFSTQ